VTVNPANLFFVLIFRINDGLSAVNVGKFGRSSTGSTKKTKIKKKEKRDR